MARKTDIGEEVEERADYFADWVKRLSDELDEARVVNERTAREFIREALAKDSNLSNLLDGMEQSGKGMDTLVKTSYIQSLIEANRLGVKLEKGVGELRKRRVSLEQSLPRRTSKDKALRKAVVARYMTPELSKKYNFNVVRQKNGTISYRDNKGRFVAQDKLLRVTDRVVMSSARKRGEYDKFLEAWKKRNNYEK